MKEKNKDEIISRRNFFKKAAGTVLPVIAMTVLPSVLTSCEIDEPYLQGSGCSTCKGTYTVNCGTGCKGGCGGGCTSNCGVSCGGSTCKSTCGGCSYACSTSCRNLCKGKNKY